MRQRCAWFLPAARYVLFLLASVLLLYFLANVAVSSYARIKGVAARLGGGVNDEHTGREVFRGAEWNVGEHFDKMITSSRFEPYSHWRHGVIATPSTNVGADGVRKSWSNPAAAAVPPGEIVDVFVFGGSACWGHGAPDDATIPSWIARHLDGAGFRNVRVVNYGESGFVTTQELITFQRLLAAGRGPRIAVFYDGFNDALSPWQGGAPGLFMRAERIAVLYNRSQERSQRSWYGRLAVDGAALVHELLLGSPLQHLIAKRFGEGKEAAVRRWREELIGHVSDETPAEVVRAYVSNLRLAKAAADAFGVELYAFWQPWILTKRPRSADEEFIWRAYPFASSVSRIFDRCHGRLLASWPTDLPLIDLSEVLDGHSESLYADVVHVGSQGNAIIARRIVDVLLAQSRALGRRAGATAPEAKGPAIPPPPVGGRPTPVSAPRGRG